jgi:tripartite-type tricarboxylate transporter receptor subunit TctC
MADELTKLLKVPLIPLNKPGAATVAGNDFVVNSKKDGYTILFATAALISSSILRPETVPYDLFKNLTPLALVTQNPFPMVVRTDAPYKNFKEMVEYAKKNPGKIRCSTMGVGSVGHFDVEIVNSVTGAGIEMVPFKGATPAVTALLGGHVEATAVAIGSSISHMRSGAVKAMVTSVKVSEFADVPTLKGLGYPQDLLGVWFAFFAPSGIPSDVKATLVSAIEKVVKDPSVASKLANLGMVQDFESPDKLLERMRAEYKIVEEIAKKSGMTK